MSRLHDGYFPVGLDADPELAEAVRDELRRRQGGIELIASEKIVCLSPCSTSRSVSTIVYGLSARRGLRKPYRRAK
jgi:glycine hydroxymethyltransferase